MQVEPLSEAEAAELAGLADGGNKRATPVTRVRPGHADLAGALKYGFNDVRDVLERASARETTARVAAGGVARAFLAELGIEVWSFTAEVGGVAVDPAKASRIAGRGRRIAAALPRPGGRGADDRPDRRGPLERATPSGGVFEVVAHGLPIGLGSYVHWDRRLDAALAAAVMSINIVKGVEFGLGFEQTRRFGSAVHDVIAGRAEGGRWIHRSNNAGGLTGGVTNGEPLVVRGAVKPISTLARPLPSADLITGETVDKAHYERSDISVVPAAGVVGEAMVMLTLADFVLDKFGGDSLDETRDNLRRLPGPDRPTARGAGRRRARRGRGRGRSAAGRRRRGRLRRRRLGRPMDLVLVGLPGSGKTAVGRRMAARHDARFIDLDATIEARPGRRSPSCSRRRARRGFRARERPPSPIWAGPTRRPAAPGHRHRRRRGGRSGQSLGALSRPAGGLAEQSARGPRPAPAQLAQSPAAAPGPRPGRGNPRPGRPT